MAHFLNALRGRIGDLGHEPLTPNVKRILIVALACVAVIPLIVYGALNHRDVPGRAATVAVGHSANSPVGIVADSTTEEKRPENSGAGDSATVTLPDGEKLQGSSPNMEYRLVKYVDRTTQTQSNDPWFDFDRLSYSVGKALPDQVTQDQVQNLAKIMNAFPDVNVLVGGFADGNTKASKKLSDARAKNIKTELVQLGVEQSRITARGFGNDRPVSDNSDISLLVTKK